MAKKQAIQREHLGHIFYLMSNGGKQKLEITLETTQLPVGIIT